MPLLKFLATVAVVLLLFGNAPAARGAEPTFSGLSAEAPLGGPTIFHATVAAEAQPARIEALLSVPGDRTVTVLAADVTAGTTAGTWSATATFEGHVLANTPLSYRFRATDSDEVQHTSSAAQILVADTRFAWRSLNGPIVRLHWYSGDDAFAQRALDIGEKAISNASTLLGVTETEPIDFFIYDNSAPFRDALGPGTRENVAGRAVANIRTMYGLILPSQVNEDWVDILVTHELTHLVFDTATRNVYHFAPHWLNEGIATYLSEGVSPRWESAIRLGKASNSLIPLQGMGATFGAGDERFDLGYAEGVSAVDYFVKTYGEPMLWELVRSYAEGLSDDDAFTRATGADLPSFNSAWMESIGATVPAEVGPQPGPTGRPIGSSPAPPAGTGIADQFAIVGLVALVLIIGVGGVILLLRRNRRPPAPPAPPAPPPPPEALGPPDISAPPRWEPGG